MQKFINEFLAFNKNKWLWMLQQESTIFFCKSMFLKYILRISNQIKSFYFISGNEAHGSETDKQTDRNG